jgi:4-amino-4-deoxy-L-arabinose transferase-like glycosyltransferase
VGADARAALLLLVALTAFRLTYSAHLGFAQDEAHYWQWSRHPALSYYDQGPGIALCIRLGTALFGATTFGVRFVPVLLSGATGWLAYLVAARWAGGPVAWVTLLLLSTAPLFAAGSLLATYDNPQAFFWAAALFGLTWTLQGDRAYGWYVVGVLVGLGALCKLTMLLFAPCVLIFLVASPDDRRWLRTPHPYAAFVLALLLFAPVILWNATHDWANLRHTAALTGRTRNAPPLRWLGEFLGGQLGLIGPTLFPAELAALWRLRRPLVGMPDRSRAFIVSFGAPILLLCLTMALHSKLEPNWPTPTHIAGLIAVGAVVCLNPWRAPGRGRTAVWALVAPGALLSLPIFFPALLPSLHVRLSADLAQKLNEPYGWETIAARVQQERVQLARERTPVFVAATNYRVASILAFYLPDQPDVPELYLGTRRDQYWYWSDPARYVGQNAILVLSEPDDRVEAFARRLFDRVDDAPAAVVTRPGFDGVVKKWPILICRGFHGYDPNQFVVGY